MDNFNFAGFSFPRPVAMLPAGPMAKRLARMRNPVTGPYIHAPKPNDAGEFSFYLNSDFMPGLRWSWCDDVEGVRIRHTGWFTDEFGDSDKIRGIVLRLPHGKGFLAGWSMGESMASVADPYIYMDESDAAYAADSMAQQAAEREQEYRAQHGDADD